MMVEFFRGIERSKWPRWTVLSIIPALSIVAMLNGFFWSGLQLGATYLSIFVGLIAGNSLGKWTMIVSRKEDPKLESRLCSGLSCFGFLFLPFAVYASISVYIGQNIEDGFLREALWAACIGFVVFFALGSQRNNE